MKPSANDYAAVSAGMVKQAAGFLGGAGRLGGAAAGLLQWPLLGALAAGPLIGGVGAYAHVKLKQPSGADFERLRKMELLSTYRRLTEQAQQRARQMKGSRD